MYIYIYLCMLMSMHTMHTQAENATIALSQSKETCDELTAEHIYMHVCMICTREQKHHRPAVSPVSNVSFSKGKLFSFVFETSAHT